MWRDAYREAVLNVKEGKTENNPAEKKSVSGTRVSETNNKTPEILNSGKINQDVLNQYKKDVDAVLNGTYKGTDVLVMGSTPKIYTDIGLSNRNKEYKTKRSQQIFLLTFFFTVSVLLFFQVLLCLFLRNDRLLFLL